VTAGEQTTREATIPEAPDKSASGRPAAEDEVLCALLRVDRARAPVANRRAATGAADSPAISSGNSPE
jgi:hypothetical protein